MISKSEIKFLKSLNLLKFRNKHNMFKVEGWKSLKEFLVSDYKLVSIFATNDWMNAHNEGSKTRLLFNSFKIASEKQLKSISSLKNPNQIIGVFEKKQSEFNFLDINKKLTIVLEDVRNPGNFGSIIRTVDWFGIKNIICSKNSVDLYNPKVVQSSMGSLSRISVIYTDLKNLIIQLKKEGKYLLAADTTGEDFYKQEKLSEAIIFFGNESKGICEEIKLGVAKKIKIPNYNDSCESLNLSVSVGIIISEILRSKK